MEDIGLEIVKKILHSPFAETEYEMLDSQLAKLALATHYRRSLPLRKMGRIMYEEVEQLIEVHTNFELDLRIRSCTNNAVWKNN